MAGRRRRRPHSRGHIQIHRRSSPCRIIGGAVPGFDASAGNRVLRPVPRIVGLLATLLMVGGVAFATFVVGDDLSERSRVHRRAALGGIVLAASTAAAALAHTVIREDRWSAVASGGDIIDALSSAFGVAVVLRVLGGLTIFAALRSEPSKERRSPAVLLGIAATALVIVSYSFDGHTVTEGPQWLHAAVNAAHVWVAAVWSGGVAMLAGLLGRRCGDGSDTTRPLLRFSQMAAVSLVLAGVAGTAMAVLVMDRFADLWSTPWGRLLIAKIALVAIAAGLGARNRWVHIPAVTQTADQDPQALAHQRVRRSVVVEAVVLGCVGVVTAFLVGASAL